MAEYFISCIKALAKEGYYVHIIHWPVNSEAPFVFKKTDGVSFYQRDTISENNIYEIIQKIDPSIIICSGWIDKLYLKTAFYSKIPTVLSLDNHWTGSIKQQLLRIFSRYFLHNKFSHVWVPGEPQKEYAVKLGFPSKNIFTGYYCADINKFNNLYNLNFEKKKNNFPKRFIYFGRYVKHKGIYEMWEAFIRLHDKHPNNWEMWCIGTGDQFPYKTEHDKIKHFGFVQPDEIGEYIGQTGVFILPSLFEPWGVAVQEFAAAGYPLLLSKAVGASDTFLKDGENGFFFEPKNVSGIFEVMKKITSMSDSELINMGEISHNNAQKINPDSWIQTIKNIILSN
jgi:glycosyltransferase involved in cell wall biosynthesis